MRVGITLPGSVRPQDAGRLAAQAEAGGCDAVWILDVRREPYLLAAAAVQATRQVQVGTNVAVAFARSPTVTATAAWDLAIWSGGRFVLGLGSQVGPTLTARFGVAADHPGPRMLDYVRAVRGCFTAFRSGRGRYDGAFYRIGRPAFQPGGEDLEPDPPIYLAAVNPIMGSVAGEVGDGLAAHPFSTPEYLRDVLRPALAAGAGKAGRPTPPVLLQLVVAPTRAAAATQMYAYSIPGYRRVLDHAGLGELADRVMAASREEARTLIERGYLDRLGVIIGDDLAAGIGRWRGLADRITLSVPWFGTNDGDQLHQTERLIQRIGSLT
ncbi:MAG TPA: LLM class flavin-dependent oxidoreductase [Candidatus Dormibacteraeota bacterium]|nr:LLM class flavin-dependent oxidoreductase [Candidatus Dormibacteraeota bacterium]